MKEAAGEFPTTATVRFAKIALASDSGEAELALDLSAELRSAMFEASDVERYNRKWHFGGLDDVPGRPGFIKGKVGFEDARDVPDWDEKLRDFVEVSVPDGSAFPFVVDLRGGQMAYQANRSARVLSAFQALLNTAHRGRWRVQSIMVQRDWRAWRKSVTRIDEIRFTAHRPNPNYVGRERVKGLLEPAHAGTLRFILEADPNHLEGLDVEAEYVRQLLAHADLGYGRYQAVGEVPVRGRTVEQRFDSAAEGAELFEELPVGPSLSVPDASLADSLATVPDDARTEVTEDDGTTYGI